MLQNNAAWLCQEPDGSVRITGPGPRALLAGSFNPLHQGHRLLNESARRLLGLPVAYELSIRNVDKPELTEEEVRRRLEQFRGIAPIYVTRAMTFERKATLFPDCVMVVGHDTAERIVSPSYYGDELASRDRSLEAIRQTGGRFLVAGRRGKEGFIALEQSKIPPSFRGMFEGISEADFRLDVSSSQLRCQSSLG